MAACSAFGCTNRFSKKIPGISFHRFPTDVQLRDNWIKSIRRKDWSPSEYSRLCSAHFTHECFDRFLNRARLRENSVPTIFESFPSYYKNVKQPRRHAKDRSEILKDSISNKRTPSPDENASPDVNPPKRRKSNSDNEILDHQTLIDTTVSYAKKLKVSSLKGHAKDKKIRNLSRNLNRCKKKITTLSNLLVDIKKNRLLEDDAINILGTAAPPNAEFLTRQLAKAKNEKGLKKYSPEFRTFALTLHYYSVSAYQYVRSTFNSCLPHPRTIANWYSQIDGKPGFSDEAMKAISEKIDSSTYQLVFALIVDEMAIKKHVEFDGKIFFGYVDMGASVNDDSLPLAKEVYVFMLVCINENWKIPVGYFLTDGLNSLQRGNLLTQCLILMNSVKAKVVSVTFDGLSSNLTAASNLGCILNPHELKTTFCHPETQDNVAVMLDPAHMLKLVRNTLGDKKSIVNGANEFIDWKYITALHKLQEDEGMHLGNKLRALHVNYFKNKMKVSLATQLLSKSVADAIEFCREILNLDEFKGSEATVAFIRIFNDLFDILNSHSLKQINRKKAICRNNWQETLQFLNEAYKYIYSLKTSCDGPSILECNRKTGFLGFLICIKSVIALVDSLILAESSTLVYLPCYKLSQDHLELFFSSIRRHGGRNNNPTTRQFMSAYKKMLIKAELKASNSANCLSLSAITILNVNATQKPVEAINATTTSICLTENDNSEQYPCPEPDDHDYMFNACALSLCAENIVYYIAGFVVRKLTHKLKCQICIDALYDSGPDVGIRNRTLTSYKSYGKLVYPSKDVFLICKKSESHFRLCVNLSGGKTLKNNLTILSSEIPILDKLSNMGLFSSLDEHMFDTNDSLNNHYVHLLRSIIHEYLNVRFMYFSKSVVDSSKSLRQLYTKAILLQGF